MKLKKLFSCLLALIMLTVMIAACGISDEEYDAIFDQGYDSGYNSGYADGSKDGNKKGYDNGYAQGYEKGYADASSGKSPGGYGEEPSVQITVPSGDVYIGVPYQLEYEGFNGTVENPKFTIVTNGANAVIDNDFRITAASTGTVQVKFTGTISGKTLSAEGTINFTAPTISLDVDRTKMLIGDKLPLACKIEPENLFEASSDFIRYEVTAGNANILKDGGNYYIVGLEAGNVTVKMTYRNQTTGVEFSSVDTLSFISRSFEISLDGTEFLVYQDMKLSANGASIPDFKADRVTYVLESGKASLNGSTLKATDEGTVKVRATYELNGAVITSNTLTVNFKYGGNVIRTAEDLLKLKDSKETFHLVKDIDLSSYTDWEPITGFSGVLLGNGHKITGLNLQISHFDKNQGLFDILIGQVSNLTLEGTISGTGEANYIGLLCGVNKGVITNVTVSGSIAVDYCNYVGGIAGCSENSDVTNCTSNVDIKAKDYVGGIVGYLTANRKADKMITGNVNGGELKGTNYVGGIFGYMTVASAANNDTVTVYGCTNTGAIIASGNNAGGILGYACGNHSYYSYTNYYSYIKITSCENKGAVSGSDCIGGIVGNANSYVSEISLCKNEEDITGNLYIGGYAGYANGTTMLSLENRQTITGKAWVGGIAGYAGKVQSCVNKGTLVTVGYHVDDNNNALSYVGGIAGYATGALDCTNEAAVDISSGGNYVGGIVGYLNATRSASEIIEGNENLGEIKGTNCVGGIFGYMILQDGANNDTITVIENKNSGAIVASGNYVGGIAGYACGDIAYYSYTYYYAYIKFTFCENTAAVSGVDCIGGIVGNANVYVSEISLCKNEDAITGNLYVGGFAGYASGTLMRSLENRETITGKAYLGGIAGHAGKLESCVNKGTIEVTGYHLDAGNNKLSYVGGIAGYATGAVDCQNDASLDISKGGSFVGGIVGYMDATRSASATIEDNENHGEIKGTDYVGGIFGYMILQDGANNDTITVIENKNSGAIIASGNYVGGIAGYACGDIAYYSYTYYYAYIKFVSCENKSSVKGNDYVGGIVGNANIYVSEISLCKNEDAITGNLYVGGFAGYANGTLMRTLENRETITGKAWVGGIAGYAGKMDTCVNKGMIEINGYHLDTNNKVSFVGGIAGYATGAVDCTNEISLDVGKGGSFVGGIVGYMDATRSATGTIKNNENLGEIKGTDYVGGIFGYMILQDGSNNDTITVTENKNSGAIVASGNYVGGIVGYACGDIAYYSYTYYYAYIKFVSCENNAAVKGNDYVGGIAGHANTYVSEITLCQNEDSVTGNAWVGGIAGYASKLTSCINKGTITITGYYMDENNNKFSYVGGIAGYATGVSDCENEVSLDVSEGGSYVGGIVGYLNAARSASEMIKNNVNLGDVKGTDYVGGIFGYMTVQTGTNHDTITVEGNKNNGALVSATGDHVGGIVGYVCGKHYYYSYGNYYAYVKLISCENKAAVEGTDYVGGIAGNANIYVSEISLCENAGDVTGNLYVGGYVGYASGTKLYSLTNNETITGKAWVGGIAGYAGKMDTCVNKGEIKITGYHLDDNHNKLSYVGGIAGYATGAVDCKNEVSLDVSECGSYVGGIVGYMDATRSASETIKNNVNLGEIKGTDCVGGIFGYMTLQTGTNHDTITVEGNKNTGSIIATGDYVGGIAGYACGRYYYASYTNYYAYFKFISCDNKAAVTGSDYVGGIVGNANVYISEISLCKNEGNITGNLYVGGFAGYANETYMSNMKNGNTVTGKAWVGGIAGYAGKIESCENTGKLVITGYELDADLNQLSYVGGIAGYATGALKCTNSADIDASIGGKYVGGLVGYLEAVRSAANAIDGNTNSGAVKGTSYVGGLFGYMTIQAGTNNDTVTANGNKNTGSVTATGDYVGGIAGYVCGRHYYASYTNYYAYVKLISCANTANVSGADYVCGIAGACGSYVNTEEAVWNMNTVSGTVTATGTNTSDKYIVQ